MATAQVNLGIQLSGGSLDMEAPYNNYRFGYQTGVGFIIYDEIKWINDLSWETGMKTSYGQTGFYPLKRGNFMVINGNYPLNTSEKIQHRFWTLDIPVKLRYNGFGFMGIMGNVEISYLLDGNIYIPSLSRTNRIYKYNKFTPILEGGLFFPIGNKIILEGTAFSAVENRFYTASTKDKDGKIIDTDGHSDFGFRVNISYKLN